MLRIISMKLYILTIQRHGPKRWQEQIWLRANCIHGYRTEPILGLLDNWWLTPLGIVGVRGGGGGWILHTATALIHHTHTFRTKARWILNSSEKNHWQVYVKNRSCSIFITVLSSYLFSSKLNYLDWWYLMKYIEMSLINFCCLVVVIAQVRHVITKTFKLLLTAFVTKFQICKHKSGDIVLSW